MLLTVVQGQIVSMLGILNGTIDDYTNSTAFKIFVNIYYVQNLVLCATVIDVLFGFCGELYNSSKKCIRRLNHHQLLYQSRVCRRIVKSLNQVKMTMTIGTTWE